MLTTCSTCGASIVRRGKPRPNRFCGFACKAEWQRWQRPVTREWLRQKYLVEGLGTYEIGALVGRDPKRVWEWLRDDGVPTRGRGTNPVVHFRKGEPSLFLGRHHTAATRQLFREQKLASGSVPYLKNGVHYLKGKRGAETPNWKGGLTPERQAFYATPEWRDAVKAVWRRADALCERCGLDHRSVVRGRRGTFHIHHIESFTNRERRADVSNLVLLCRRCHLWVHSRDNEERELLWTA